MASRLNTDTSGHELMEATTFNQYPQTRPPRRLQSFIDHYGAPSSRTPPILRAKNRMKNFCHTLSWISLLNALLDRIPLIRCLKEYNLRNNLFGDITAGITVAIMHIPQGMAYGILTTLPPIHGLYVSFFPVLVYMIFGTSPHLSMGTFAVISLMTAQAIDGTPLRSTHTDTNQTHVGTNISDSMIVNEKLGIATTLAFLVGMVQLILSFLRLGFLTVYLTEPFISGFTTGAAVHVFSSQIPSVFGVRNPRSRQSSFKLPRFYFKLIGTIISNINWISTVLAVTATIILYVAKRVSDRYKSKLRIIIPCELILVIVGTIISHFTQLDTKYRVSVVGPIKRGLPPPTVPPFTQISYLILPAITIAVVSLCVSISMAKMLSRKHSYHVSSNQELLAYGMANIVSSFFQCYPNAGSLSRSVVQEGSGGKTQLVGAFSCTLLTIVLLALTPLFHSLPMACLAAIVIVNLKGLFLQVKDFFFYYRISKLECLIWISTFLSTVLFEVDIGLYVGLCTSFLVNTVRTQKPRFAVLGQIDDTEIYKNVKAFPSAQQFANIKILRFDESLYACNGPFFKRKFYELIGMQLHQKPLITRRESAVKQEPTMRYAYVILECSPFNFIDTVGVKLLIEIFQDLKKREIQLYLSECRDNVRYILDLMDFYGKTAQRIIYVTTHDAVMAARSALVNDPTASLANNEV